MHVPQTDIILRHEGVELVRKTLPPGEYVIGRTKEAEILADTPLISRKHARLTINYDYLLLEDLGSSNGTFVNDKPVTKATRLFPNQAIRLGTVQLEIHRQRTPTEPGVSLAPAQATIRRLLPDELLAEKRYAIGSIVAKGGMGAILAAQQSAMKRGVAMKVMLDSAGETDVFRFIEEAQITGQLEHPNIVPVHELGVDENDQLYYTMKMVHGITLKKVLSLLKQGVPETEKKYPLPALLTIFQKVCDAIAFAHSKGVIHRDLKPENVMLDDFGVVLVMDWGLAKVIGHADSSEQDAARSAVLSVRVASGNIGGTQAGTIMGTPQYMSPEQARGEIETLDARSDIYALGAILFQLLALRPPVLGRNAAEVVDKVARGEVEWSILLARGSKDAMPADTKPTGPRRRVGNRLPGGRVPDSLVAVVRKAMALDRARRYANVTDLQADVLAYQSGFATSAENAGALKQLTLLIKRNKAAAIGVAAVLIVGTALGTKALLEGKRAELEATRAIAQATLAGEREKEAESEKSRAVALIRFMDAEIGDSFVDSIPVQLRERVSSRVDAFYNEHGALASLESHERMSYYLRKALVHLAAIERYEGEPSSEVARTQHVNWERGDAVAALKEALRIGESLAAQPLDEQGIDRGITRDQILVHYELATLAAHFKDEDGATEHLLAARKILDALVEGGPFSRVQWVNWMGLPDLVTGEAAIPIKGVSKSPVSRAFDLSHPHSNGLGMRFVPVPGTQVQFSVYQTRVRDFRAFIRETGYVHMRETTDSNSRMWSVDKDGNKQRGYSWENPGFVQTEEHPVVGVSWQDAKSFCEWLTFRERASGGLPGNWEYRLATDNEWSVAVGLDEDPTKTPEEKNSKIKDKYPWGNSWPPPVGTGNYAGSEANDGHWPSGLNTIGGYHDGFARTAPVGSFKPNQYGIYDLGGNVSEWCEDAYDRGSKHRVLRGASWRNGASDFVLSSVRFYFLPTCRYSSHGFRCVAALSSN